MYWTAIRIWALCTIVTGILYPLTMCFIGSHLFYDASQGFPWKSQGRLVGFRRIGQTWKSPHYFWSRPTASQKEGKAISGASNLAWSNPQLWKEVKERERIMKAAHPNSEGPVPNELLFTSGSGVDSHMSKKALEYQISRVLKARGREHDTQALKILQEKIQETICASRTGFGDMDYVSILRLNILLDDLWPMQAEENQKK